MSTTPESNYKIEANKLLVSMTLKIPLQFEIELQAMQNTDSQSNYQDLNTAINTNSDLIVEKINQAKIDEQARVLSNKLATQILNNQSLLAADNTDTWEENVGNLERDRLSTGLNTENKLEIEQEIIHHIQKKRKVRLGDSFNDSLTLAVNFVGTMLFLGKLANYSWE